MYTEKHIEEMAQEILGISADVVECGLGDYVSKCLAVGLYNASYRKQEWISVEERLPDLEPTLIKWGDCGYKQKSIRVLCVCKQKSGKLLVKEGYYEVWADALTAPRWRIPGSIDSVTHWMPLPETPKMTSKEDKKNG